MMAGGRAICDPGLRLLVFTHGLIFGGKPVLYLYDFTSMFVRF